jgi:hypothetical protein
MPRSDNAKLMDLVKLGDEVLDSLRSILSFSSFVRYLMRWASSPLRSSYTSTSLPRAAAYKAANAPTGPAPITTILRGAMT